MLRARDPDPAAGCGDQDPDRRQLMVTWSAARAEDVPGGDCQISSGMRGRFAGDLNKGVGV